MRELHDVAAPPCLSWTLPPTREEAPITTRDGVLGLDVADDADDAAASWRRAPP